MSKRSEKARGKAAANRKDKLFRSLDGGIDDALESQGVQMLGLSIRNHAFSCLLTIRADIGGVRSVSFVASNNVINCLLKAQNDAEMDRLTWRTDEYYK